MKRLFEATTTGSVCGGGYNKVLNTDKTPVKRQINTTVQSSSCPCKTLPGKVTCGICNPRKK